MSTGVSTNRQTNRNGWQTAATTARLRRVGRIHPDYRNSGTFRLLSQYVQESCPSRVVGGLSKSERPNNALDIQIFVGDDAIATNQRKRGLVMKVLTLIGDVCVDTGEDSDCLAAVRPSALLPRHGSLATTKFSLRLSVKFRCVHGFAVARDEKRLQTEVNSDSGIWRGFRHRVSYVADEHDVPVSSSLPTGTGVSLKGGGFDRAFYGPMQFEFDVADVLESGFSVHREFRAVANREVHAVKPTVSTETREPRLVARLQATEERLESAVKPLERSLAGGEVRQRQEGVALSRRFEMPRLFLVGDSAALGIVHGLALTKRGIVQTAVRLQQAGHRLGLSLVRIRPVAERLLHLPLDTFAAKVRALLLVLDIGLDNVGGYMTSTSRVIRARPERRQAAFEQGKLFAQNPRREAFELVGVELRRVCRRHRDEQVNVVGHNFKPFDFDAEFFRLLVEQFFESRFDVACEYLSAILGAPDHVQMQIGNRSRCSPITRLCHASIMQKHSLFVNYLTKESTEDKEGNGGCRHLRPPRKEARQFPMSPKGDSPLVYNLWKVLQQSGEKFGSRFFGSKIP
jgi:hypothetical protein